MKTTIALDAECLYSLDLSPLETVIKKWLDDGSITAHEQDIRFDIQFPREPDDPRELSEIPEIRLWFVRLDARYPWIPFVLDWESGELARYTAMLVPHQFSPEGIQYNPEALEIFVMKKAFSLMDWMQQQGIASRTKIKFMLKTLGYELEDGFFDLVQFGA